MRRRVNAGPRAEQGHGADTRRHLAAMPLSAVVPTERPQAAGRPATNARNRARTRHPWSRELVGCGESELVDYSEDGRETQPGRRDDGWNPSVGSVSL